MDLVVQAVEHGNIIHGDGWIGLGVITPFFDGLVMHQINHHGRVLFVKERRGIIRHLQKLIRPIERECIIIFWCLYAFIASGFEHSVANMTVFSLALFSEHPETISFLGACYNLFWVTIGNTVSGAVLMGTGYWYAAGRPMNSEVNTK